MKKLLMFAIFLLAGIACAQDYTIVLHGGAGGMKPENISAEKQEQYKAKMEEALKAGEAVLDTGGKAVDAVVAVLEVMENSPLYNAGKGAVFTWDETNEMDASLMRGKDRQAGAVAAVTKVKNPIKAAREVMLNSKHVLLSGPGANQFAKQQKLEMVNPEYFRTEEKLRYLRKRKARHGSVNPDDWKASKMGTVGCAVRDKNGNLAAGTSTGGMTGKRYGRIGDSPIPGAGTYAANETCAISCTGHGEYFICFAVAHDMHARMKYNGESITEAAENIIHGTLKEAGGAGGLIGVDKNGNIVKSFNTSGMFRASVKEGEEPEMAIFKY